MRKEQFEEWRAHPSTVEIFEELLGVRDDLKEALACGETIGSKVQTARVVGQIEGLNQLLNIRFDGGGLDEK